MENEQSSQVVVEAKKDNEQLPNIQKRIFKKPQRNSDRNDKMFSMKKSNNLQVMFFGGVGLDGIGGNMTALRYGDDIIVIDCGVGFPDADLPGVDLVIPNMDWLKKNANLVKGVVVTHAHEDHIGALPYFLDTIKAPVYGSKLTLAFIDSKLREHPKVKLKGVTVNPRNVVKIGVFSVEFIHVTHSMPGAYALAITTPAGVVFHSGDFKIDMTPLSGEVTDLSRFGELGQKGVTLMLCESTNVERPGLGLSEKVVVETLDKIVKENDTKRIIITAFVSNVHRVQKMMEIAKKYNRKVAFAGRSMIKNMEVSMKLGEIKYDKNLIIDIDNIRKYADNELLILATGSQGQMTTALSRMANGEITGDLGKNDVVIFSSSPVPGNEKAVSDLINRLIRTGARVIYNDMMPVHATGHAYRQEIALVHKLIKPKYFMPIHGEPKHQLSHKELAISLGMKEQNIITPEVGMVVDVNHNFFRQTGTVPAGTRLIDGFAISEEDDIVLKDRLQLGDDGMCIVVIGVHSESGKIVTGPELIPRGFMYNSEINRMTEQAKQAVMEAMQEFNPLKQDWAYLKSVVRKTLTNFFFKKTKRKPIIVPVLYEDKA